VELFKGETVFGIHFIGPTFAFRQIMVNRRISFQYLNTFVIIYDVADILIEKFLQGLFSQILEINFSKT